MNAWAESGRGPKNRAEPHKNPPRLGAAALTINCISSFGFMWLQAVQKPKKGFPQAVMFFKKRGTEIKAAD